MRYGRFIILSSLVRCACVASEYRGPGGCWELFGCVATQGEGGVVCVVVDASEVVEFGAGAGTVCG